MIFLFSFKVGVNVPWSTENYTFNIVNFITCWAFDIAFSFAFWMPYVIILFNFGHDKADETVLAELPLYWR